MTADHIRDRIVALRIRGLSTRQIALRVGLSQSTVRYHLWFDACDPEDRVGGYYGKNKRPKTDRDRVRDAAYQRRRRAAERRVPA